MIILIMALVVFTLIYTDFYSYDFIVNFVNSGFDIREIIVISMMVLLILFNILLNLDYHRIDKKYFNRYFGSEEEYHSATRKRFLFNGINRFLLVLIFPIVVVFLFYLIEKTSMLDIIGLRVIIYIVLGLIMIISMILFYATDLLMPLDLLLCGEIGFGSFCDKCHYSGADAFKLDLSNKKENWFVYKCVSCKNEIKVEKFHHIFISVLKKIHLHE